jgi:endonuclease/exonuclease/phosphatase family metal-dependent hydrolase
MAYNIHHGEGVDGRIDLKRLAAVIREADPDLVALQEVDNKTGRTGHVDQTAELSRLTGLHGYFGRQIDYEGGEYGQALLSRFPMSDLRVQWLPGQPERERRIVFSGTFDFEGAEIVFASTHLHHANEEFRQQQAAELNRLFESSGQPVILAGDLNAVPDSEPIAALRRNWSIPDAQDEELLTYPAQAPERQLDYILVRPSASFALRKIAVVKEPVASDHRPLAVEFEIVQP